MNKQQQRFSSAKRFGSFIYAFNGLRILLREEHNSWIHIAAAVIAVVLGFIFQISGYEWIAIIFAIGLVIALEIVNSAIENLSDFVSPERHDSIKKIKDLAAAAVLIGAITALAVGLIIFIPKILIMLNA
ncbi:MAG: diacylglycerol kinase [Candidatus Fluviicola riflensis]|nr:MAG: diacylglycerol kinase [Candidatus Fluviicola riflensis]OGS79684.1 MAG: diacylglycerol kinase [Candidatus Fluviicola riflensis]OGS87115.1 MAG: diacylglycerol kinase [Fluviicola sp. RIFCSPHIGHO2_01_FULL_43_53]OGS89904.1 MAG: diacylglycerol kinase [Fluviicola sp. RIFCSPHIGHO2_12_FULL_43_24]